MIKPTVGRLLWFHRYGSAPALAAIVTWVWSDTCVNVAVFGQNGSPVLNPPTSVRLVQPEEPQPDTDSAVPWCEWMPFQVGQSQAVKDAQESVPVVDAAAESETPNRQGSETSGPISNSP